MSFVQSRVTGSRALTNEELHRIAPSIFAEAAHESRSSRYAHIPTISVIENLRHNGFMPVKVTQARVCTDKSRQDYTKHMLRFRHADYMQTALSVGQVFPEVVMVNSHDGSSSYKLMAGLFRLVCSNGMTASTGQLGEVRVRHSGDVVREVLGASFDVLTESRKLLGHSETWSQKQLTSTQANALAVAAHHIRFADADGNIDTPITPDQLLRARRSDDRKDDLWTTFNRVQENVIKGGITNWDYKDGKRRRVTTREVKGIDGDVNLNRALWKLTEALAKAI